MYVRGEALWERLLVDDFIYCSLRITLVSLHDFSEFLGEVSRLEMFCVLGVEPVVSCGG